MREQQGREGAVGARCLLVVVAMAAGALFTGFAAPRGAGVTMGGYVVVVAFFVFAGAFGPEGRAPGAEPEECAEEDDGVETLAAGEGPDGVADVEPEGEFIEGEGGAHAVDDGDEASGEEGAGCGSGADFGHHGIAGDQEQGDAPDQVMDVASAEDDPAEGADVEVDEEDEETYAEEGEDEAEGGEEEAAAGAVGNALMQDSAGAGHVQQDEDDGGAGGHERQNDPRSRPVHDDYSDSAAEERASHQSGDGNHGAHHPCWGYRPCGGGGRGGEWGEVGAAERERGK